MQCINVQGQKERQRDKIAILLTIYHTCMHIIHCAVKTQQQLSRTSMKNYHVLRQEIQKIMKRNFFSNFQS